MTVDQNHLKVFSGRASREMTQDLCAHLGIDIGLATSELFPDGEVIVRVDEDVRGR
jgi:ribose-phosphate pyrophosphokinase